MGTVYNRGTRSKPRWYVSFYDRDGKRRWVPSKQPTKTLARRFLEQVEARIADGLVGLPTGDDRQRVLVQRECDPKSHLYTTRPGDWCEEFEVEPAAAVEVSS